MGGDKLNLLLFWASIGAAGVMGAVATNGIRARVLWGVGLLGLLLAVSTLYAAPLSPFVRVGRTLYLMSPLIAVAVAILVTGGRKPLERRRVFSPPVLNPGLTVEYVSGIVSSGTHLEAQRRLEAHAHERAKLVAQVRQIKDAIFPAGVEVDVTFAGIDRSKKLHFRKGQEDALAVIKIGDWIEFTGQIKHSSAYGWEVRDCEFIGPTSPPKMPRRRRAQA